MEALIPSMLMWICLQVGCEVPPAPEVETVSRAELSRKVYGELADVDSTICGVYDSDIQTIFLPDGHCPGDLLDQSILLHELVHHVQVVTGMEYPCPPARERLAYELQARWLQEMGVEDPYTFMQVNEFTIFIRSLCGPE